MRIALLLVQLGAGVALYVLWKRSASGDSGLARSNRWVAAYVLVAALVLAVTVPVYGDDAWVAFVAVVVGGLVLALGLRRST